MTPKHRAAYAEYDRLLAASDRVRALCNSHPVPPPKPGSTIIPKGCTCYSLTPEFRAFMSWQAPFCNICGGEGKCKASCDALDKRY